MADRPPEDDRDRQPGEREPHAYDRMLERVRDALEDLGSSPQLHLALERAKERAVELGELSREEADRVGEYLRRDLQDAGEFLAAGGRGLRDWLQFDLEYLEQWFRDYWQSATDMTRVELANFERGLGPVSYYTGEVAAPGTFACRSCGQTVTLRRTGHLPPCPRCHGKAFNRLPARGH
ncbi:MAG TPA: zinc ribbon-containing protein [Gammaproteobacteria bacterium]|nr:zinc ribbon-containing protein [Gammaproteobacteria bacterium]